MLDAIVAGRREALNTLKQQKTLQSLRRAEGDTPRPFFRKGHRTSLICECKKASPSAGIIAASYDPAAIAALYEAGGAGAVSVLTEPDFFQGSDAHLIQVRSRVALPVLRKDFIIDPYQVHESFAIGADIILLIAAVLTPAEVEHFAGLAHELGMEVLLECRNADEIACYAGLGADAVGINARNLDDFSVSLEQARALAALLPPGPIAVAESGIRSIDDALAQAAAGFGAFLIGEYFMRAPDPAAAVRAMAEALARREA